jgi:3-oxoacyl-[acyl-carrier-protein] synthase II
VLPEKLSGRESRVAVTGVGVVCALGSDAETSFRRLVNGEVGIAPLRLFDVAGQRCGLAAEVDVASLARGGDFGGCSRSDVMAITAAEEALRRSGLDATRSAVSVVVGGTTGGMFEAEETLARHREGVPGVGLEGILSYPLSASADALARRIARVDRAVTICSACSSGSNALVLGAALIREGRASSVLAGGTEGLCRLTFTGFNALGVMSPEPCRPFDKARDGLTLGEGAAFVLLEEEAHALARGAPILAWLDGFAVAAEAYHITHPEPSARTATELIRSALGRAALGPRDIDYVNAHGTATPQNDSTEAHALAEAFGSELERIYVSSSKGQVGHTLGTAGAVGVAFTVLALANGVVPPSGGLVTPDPAFRLRHVLASGERAPLGAALVSSFGFGGTGAVLALTRADRPWGGRGERRRSRLLVTAVNARGGFGTPSGVEIVSALAGPAADSAPKELLTELDPARSRRFDRASALVTRGAERALADAARPAAGVGLVAGSAYGNVERSVEFLRRVFERGPRFAPPAEFPHLVPSGPAGNASIYLGLTGPVLAVSELWSSAESAVAVGSSFLALGLCPALVVGSAEPFDATVASLLAPALDARATPAERRGEGASWLLLEDEGSVAERRARPLAELAAWWQGFSAAELVPPRESTRSLVLAWSDADAEILAGSAWAGVRRRIFDELMVPREARGGVVLAAAASLCAAGEAEQVLAVTRGKSQDYAFLFGAVG